MTIDPSTLRVVLSDTIGMDSPASGRYYARFIDWRDRPSIAEYEIEQGTGDRLCGGHALLDTAYLLQYRSRHHELMHGAFGRIVANISYYYAAEYSGQPTGFDVVPASNDPCFERGRRVLLADTAALALSALSAAVIVRDDSGYRVVAATWSPTGVIQSIARGRTPLAPDSAGRQFRGCRGETGLPDSAAYYGMATRPWPAGGILIPLSARWQPGIAADPSACSAAPARARPCWRCTGRSG